jgi:hypothetical protein
LKIKAKTDEIEEKEYDATMKNAGSRLQQELDRSNTVEYANNQYVALNADQMGDMRYQEVADSADSYDRFDE